MTATMHAWTSATSYEIGQTEVADIAPRRRELGSSAFSDEWLVLDGEPALQMRIEPRLRNASWFAHFNAELQAAAELRPNWNGYGERSISRSSIKRTVEILNKIGALEAQPHAVPLPNGSIQIEWHGASGSIEIEVPAEGSAQGYAYSDDDADLEDEWMVAGQPNDGRGLTKLEELLARIAG